MRLDYLPKIRAGQWMIQTPAQAAWLQALNHYLCSLLQSEHASRARHLSAAIFQNTIFQNFVSTGALLIAVM